MIAGIFDGDEARIRLQVQGPRGKQRIEAVVDTGYTGTLTLPPKLIAKLESYEYTAYFRMGPEGKPLLMEQTSEISGSGMGQEGGAHTAATYSDYRAMK